MYPFSRIVTSTYFDLFRHKHEFGPLFPFNFESDRLFFFLRFLIVFRVNTGTHSMNGEYSMMSIALPPWWHLLIVLVRKYDLFFFPKIFFYSPFSGLILPFTFHPMICISTRWLIPYYSATIPSRPIITPNFWYYNHFLFQIVDAIFHCFAPLTLPPPKWSFCPPYITFNIVSPYITLI